MKKLNIRALRLIKDSKGQFLAVTILIIVGLMIYVALSMGSVNLADGVNYYYDKTNFADIYVNFFNIDKESIRDIDKIENVKDVEGRLVLDGQIKVESKLDKIKTRVISLPEKNNINKLYTINGENNIDSDKEVLIIEQFAKATGLKVGDTLKLYIQGENYELKIKGIVASPEYVYIMENEQSLLPAEDKFGIIYVSESFLENNLSLKNQYNEITIKVKDESKIKDTKEILNNKLKKYGIIRLYSKDEQLSNRIISDKLDGVKKVSDSVPIIFLGAAAIIISAMLSRMIKNDRIPIGVLKALGYSNKSIMFHYIKISLIIGVIGSTIGIILGTILSSSIGNLYATYFNIPVLKFNFYYKFLFSALAISVIFCGLSGAFSSRKIMKILPSESMKPETPKLGKGILLDKVNFIWSRLSFTSKMVMRNIFRNKKRLIFTSLGIAISFAITLMPLAQKNAFNSVFNDHYSKFLRMDYNIDFNKPEELKAVNDIEKIVNTSNIEPKIEYPFEISKESNKKTVNIIGLKENTKSYRFTDIENKTVKLPERGILLSQGLANFIGAKKGDKIKIKSFVPGKKDLNVEVKEVVKQSLGINGYMNIEEVEDELFYKDKITGVYLNSKDKGNIKESLENIEYISNVQSLNEMRTVFEEYVDLLLYTISIMIIFAGILGFVIVYSSTIMNIAERNYELSTLRVMGFSKKEIFNIISKENIIMTILGILIGIPIGNGILASLEKSFSTEIYTLEINATNVDYLMASVITIVFVILAQLVTYKKINKLNFIESLKSRVS
ncbi:ABC-type transport system, involved in lipoprotein release, permease component [Gottschalkia purinilytica]|uniref:ABC-type transport system, involved in lipoprotein release, permease component n=1 Tax=Gottschalkia purinilytica TaxID=1503 RepID=A0A0L0W9S5_GOTPU|nr:FtsX-like permease family protein [Gottschalkia purinilytica]KNF08196.1 ABC-type transport system, involved in lipoprotein release, permease component [Gottschalkia purinilytica]